MSTEEMLKLILSKFDGIGDRLDSLEAKINKIESNQNEMKRDIKVIRETIAENKENVKALELKFNNHSHEIKDIKIVNK